MGGQMDEWMNITIDICVGIHRLLCRDKTITFMRNLIYNITHTTLCLSIVIRSSGFQYDY